METNNLQNKSDKVYAKNNIHHVHYTVCAVERYKGEYIADENSTSVESQAQDALLVAFICCIYQDIHLIVSLCNKQCPCLAVKRKSLTFHLIISATAKDSVMRH